MDKIEIYHYLKRQNIAYEITEHKAVFNMEEADAVDLPYPEWGAKNLYSNGYGWPERFCEAVPIHIGTFSNDMTTFATKDDVLTLLVHLGYLTYNSIDETVSIPNKEVSKEYVNAISTMNWHGVADLPMYA